MDLLKMISDELEPIGGELLVDRFLQARSMLQGAPGQGPAQAAAGTVPRKAPPRADTVRIATRRPEPSLETQPEMELQPEVELQPEPIDASDTGKLRAEVAAFLNRDEAEGTDDSEVQEFLKERQGFDPTDLE